MAVGWLWWRAWVQRVALDAAAVCVAGVALGGINLHFVWQPWRLATSTVTLKGRHRHRLGDIDLHFVWQAWRLAASTSTQSTYGSELLLWRAWIPFVAVDAAAVCVAGVALGDIQCHLAWQGWHLVTLTSILCGRGRTWRQRLSLCMAGVKLRDIDLHFVRLA